MIYDNLYKYQLEALNLKSKFKVTEEKEWDSLTICLELMVQIGHLNFVLLREKNSPDLHIPFIKDDTLIEDEICDVLFQLLNLANFTEINLIGVWKSREFDSKNLNCSLYENMLNLSNYAGNISDALLMLYNYKDSRDLDKDILIERIKLCVIKMINHLNNICKNFDINIDVSFKNMIKESEEYLSLYKEHNNNENRKRNIN